MFANAIADDRTAHVPNVQRTSRIHAHKLHLNALSRYATMSECAKLHVGLLANHIESGNVANHHPILKLINPGPAMLTSSNHRRVRCNTDSDDLSCDRTLGAIRMLDASASAMLVL